MYFTCKVCGASIHIREIDASKDIPICFNCYKKQNKINLWLDDLRPAPDNFMWVKTFDECRRTILKNKVNILSLDHDLGDKPELTGYDFVKWLVEKAYENSEMYPNQIYLHTANPVGRQNMYQLLNRYKPDYVKLYNGPMSNYLNPKIDY